MKQIKPDSVEFAFQSGAARDVTVIMRSAKEWYFTFLADDPLTKKTETFALLTQRGQLRIWADPRNLFSFLQEKYNVTTGSFKLIEDFNHEKYQSPNRG